MAQFNLFSLATTVAICFGMAQAQFGMSPFSFFPRQTLQRPQTIWSPTSSNSFWGNRNNNNNNNNNNFMPGFQMPTNTWPQADMWRSTSTNGNNKGGFTIPAVNWPQSNMGQWQSVSANRNNGQPWSRTVISYQGNGQDKPVTLVYENAKPKIEIPTEKEEAATTVVPKVPVAGEIKVTTAKPAKVQNIAWKPTNYNPFAQNMAQNAWFQPQMGFNSFTRSPFGLNFLGNGFGFMKPFGF